MAATQKRGVLYSLDPSGRETGDVIKLRRDATIFGREKGDVILGDAEISSSHCQVQNGNPVHTIYRESRARPALQR